MPYIYIQCLLILCNLFATCLFHNSIVAPCKLCLTLPWFIITSWKQNWGSCWTSIPGYVTTITFLHDDRGGWHPFVYFLNAYLVLYKYYLPNIHIRRILLSTFFIWENRSTGRLTSPILLKFECLWCAVIYEILL